MNFKLLKFCWMPALLFFFNSYSFAQNNNSDTTGSTLAVADEDSTGDDYENSADTLIIKTVFDDANDSIVKWKRAREFGYMAYLDSLLRKKTDLRIDTVNIDKGTLNKPRATAFLTRNNSDSFLNNFGVRIFFWIIALFFIGFIVYKLFFTGGLFASRNTKAEEEPIGREPEALNEYSAYNLLIHEAESKNDLNLAVRYLYLQSLKRLADHELIIFSPDKTNNLYLQEMAANSHLKEFSFLTLNYEYTWYGRFAIDMTKYHDLKEKFISFNKKI